MDTAAPPTMRTRILDAAESLVMSNGFHATTVDAVLDAAGASKGAFFHHFSTKADLGYALVERYLQGDLAMLEEGMAAAESAATDPAEQIIAFVRGFEEAGDEIAGDEPGCLFASFVNELVPETMATRSLVVESIEAWRGRMVEKLDAAATTRPTLRHVDLASLADHLFVTFEGAFVLARATGDTGHLRRQLAHLRHYFELLLDEAGSD